MEDLDITTEGQPDQPNVSTPTTIRKRRRPALSCAECRKRKIKCDRTVPCTQCTQSKSPTCTYTPERLSAIKNHVHPPSGPPAILTQTSTILRETCTGPSSECPFIISSPKSDQHPTDDAAESSQHSSYTESQSSESGKNAVQGLVNRVQKLEKLLSATSIDEKPNKEAPRKGVPARTTRGNFMKKRFYGPSHWMNSFEQVRKILCFEYNAAGYGDIRFKDQQTTTELNGLVEKCKVMARTIKAARIAEWTYGEPNIQNHFPPRELADQLVHLYLRTSESVYRVMHIPSFEKEYNRYWSSPESTGTSTLMKILLAMAIGSCFYQGPDLQDILLKARQWVYAAQSWENSPHEKCRLNTSLIQVQCLLLISRSIFNISGDLVWISAGSLIRSAMNLGFHRDPKHFSRISILHGEVRRRLWATIMELNLQSALDSGMPPLISLDDFDTEFPANVNDVDIQESDTSRPISKPSDVFTQTSISLSLLKSLPMKLEAAKLINDFRFEPTYGEVIRVSEKLFKNYRENHTFISQALQSPQPGHIRPTHLDRKLFDLSTQRFLLALHRPFAVNSRADPRYYYSRKLYVDCSMAVLSNPDPEPRHQTSSDGIGEQDDYMRLRLISGGFLKEVIIHAALVIYLELVLPIEDDPSFNQDRRVMKEPFRRLLNETLDLAAQRIALGETNIKGHLVLAAALGHINALEAGKSSEEGIIKASRKSAIYCAELLRAKLPSTPDANTLDEEQSPGDSMGFDQEASYMQGDVDFTMQDWGVDFGSADSWIFSGWGDNNGSF